MRGEFEKRLKKEFPECTHRTDSYAAHLSKEFSVRRHHRYEKLPTLNDITAIAQQELGGLEHNVFVAQNNRMRGAKQGDTVVLVKPLIVGGLRSIVIRKGRPEVTVVHEPYTLAKEDMQTYLNFMKRYFGSLGEIRHKSS